ncbi:Uncharacterised protein [Legionella beliardensis]|uniref:Uncharacterized protein n=1 Tax=Legionella beliardensis TaxID=91822 RepID=A0A378I1K3_9GAMM|nr:hypothetical protein [Legionella beliardensis]STX28496.1 Uncharacterised protein [Legionella beliardensis]
MKDKKLHVIAIDIGHKDPAFISYKRHKSAQEKIQLLVNKIITAYEKAQAINSNANILITWREYGITDAKDAKYITNNDKKYLLDEIKKLVAANPNLSILVGPTLIKKEREFNNIAKVKNYYRELAWVDDLEPLSHRDVFDNIKNKHFTANLKEVDNIKGPFNSVKNSAYYVSRDEKQLVVQPIGKKAPYMEVNRHTTFDYSRGGFILENLAPTPNTVFQPGKGRGKNSFFKLSNTNTRALLQICREHGLNLFVPRDNQEIVDIHFVLSASIIPQLDKIRGKHAVFIDNDYAPVHIVKDPDNLSDDSFSLSVLSLFDDTNTFRPVAPFCPLQLFLKGCLERLQESNTCKTLIDSLTTYIETHHFFDEEGDLIRLISKEYAMENSAEKNIALFEIMSKLIEELQLRKGDSQTRELLNNNNQMPINRKEFITNSTVIAYVNEDYNYLKTVFKSLDVKLEELNKKDFGDYYYVVQKTYNELRRQQMEETAPSLGCPK